MRFPYAPFGMLFGFAMAACSSGDEAQPRTPQDGAFEALTYNVAGLPQGISGSNPIENTPLISPLLNSYDLVLAQEDFVYHEDLARDATHPYQSVPKQDYASLVHDGLNRFSLFPWVHFARTQWVSCYGSASTGSGDCLAEKGFSVARTDLGEEVLLDIYNHHADAGGGPEDIAARTAGFEQFAEYILANSAGEALIVAGDTNLHGDDPDDRPVLDRFLEQTGLTDVCTALDCGDDRIDRFFFRSSETIHIEPQAWNVAPEFVDPAGEDLSDHEAVHVTFSWTYR